VAASDNQQQPTKPILGKDTLWLVKSGDRILGPFLTAEVVRRLRAKELVVIDEVISPQSRWRHIRDEAVFSVVVDEIRTGLMTVRDDTEVGDAGAKTETITIPRNADDKTPRPIKDHNTSVGSVTSAGFDSSVRASEIIDADIVEEIDDDGEVIHHASARKIEKNSDRKSSKKANVHSSLSYAPPGKERNSGKTSGKKSGRTAFVSKTSQALWALVLSAIVAIGGSIYFFKIAPARRAAVRADEVARLRKEADRAWSLAEFQRAMKLYGQINREPRLDLESDLRHAILQLRVARETLAAKRRLEELIPKLPTSEARSRARIALAVASLQADEPLVAQNALLKIIRDTDAGPIAYFNLGAAQAANGQRAEAIETLKKLDGHATLGGPSRLLISILHMRSGAMKLASSATDIDDQGQQPAWRQELYTVGAVADWIDGNKRRSNQRLRVALDTDPFQTEEFFYDPLLYFEALRWRNLLPYVKDYSAKSKSNGAKALYALALVKSDRRSDAQQVLSESLSPKVNDSDLQAVSAYSMMMQSRDEEARGALKFSRATTGGTTTAVPMISAILDARIYERAGDRNSADAVWMEVAKRPQPPVAALVSVARVDSQIATEKVIGTVERLKVLYPHSVQVMKLHETVFAPAPENPSEKASENPAAGAAVDASAKP